jgi:hypothetical protein
MGQRARLGTGNVSTLPKTIKQLEERRRKLGRTTILGTVAFIGALAAVTAEAAKTVHHRELCVGHGSGCYKTVQAAVDAARAGDTIRIGRGTFAGGVRIRASVDLVGAGARLTTIRGGGPVLTIGAFGAAREPTVAITGVTITGGLTRSSAESRKLVGKPGAVALGGGIEVPPASRFKDGATVTITDSVITGNRASPSTTVPSGLPCGPACPFALAGGGAIDNWGRMTLTNVIVSHNSADGSLASDADAGGIYTPQGHLTLRHSVVTGNRAVVSRPYGRFAEGGGVDISSTPFFLRPRQQISTLTIDASRITANAVRLSEGFPSDIEAHANTGGILIAGDDDCTKPTSGCARATIRQSLVSGNTATASNTAGDATGFGGGIVVDGSLVLSTSLVRDNRVRVTVPAGSTAGASGDSGGIGMGGYATITDSRLIDNSVIVTAPAGTASAMFAAISAGNEAFPTTINHSNISRNQLAASTTSGSAIAQGAGIGHLGGAPFVLQDTNVARNIATANGPSGTDQGGGIWNGRLDPSSSLGPLRLTDSTIARNVLKVNAGITAQGGGIFTIARPTIHHTTIAHNRPDQCHGC